VRWKCTPVSDLERLFNQIVLNLAARDPALLRRPIPLAEIRDSIVPYRANRRALLLESSEDYELALMRLCAGEGGFAHTDPTEVQDAFASEVKGPNPDLTLIQAHDQAVVRLDPGAVASALGQRTGSSYAPEEHAWYSELTPPASVAIPEQPSPQAHGTPPESARRDDGIARCNRCGGGLPVSRLLNFCPHCGLNLTRSR
jgi:hypothetical protein